MQNILFEAFLDWNLFLVEYIKQIAFFITKTLQFVLAENTSETYLKIEYPSTTSLACRKGHV